jgi:hypothetical protein
MDMFKVIKFTGVAGWLVLLTGAASAQNVALDAKQFVSDVNVISSWINKEPMMNADAAIIAGAACSSMRSAQRPEVLGSLAFSMGFAAKEDLSGISKSELASYEMQAFKQYGATRETAVLVADEIEKSDVKNLKVEMEPGKLPGAIARLEDRSCSLRELVPLDGSEKASEKLASRARSVGKGALGLSVFVVDVVVAIEAPYLAVALMSAASINWGWGRMDEAYSEIAEEFQ